MRIPRFLPSFSFLAFLSGAPIGAAEIEGHIKSRQGTPVEHARVQDTNGAMHTFSDSQGRFVLDCEIPCLLLVTHSRFEEQAVELTEIPTSGLFVELQAKQELYEEIVVTAGRGLGDVHAPVSIATTLVESDENLTAPATLVEMVEHVPGVSENGQGGIFQVLSIRGVSRQRVMTLVSGMQIVGERRAGVSTSFIDPQLMGGVEVSRGPASTYYGSGALGGVIQVFPRQYEGWRVASGYNTFGNENYQVLGWGDGEWSFGLSHRRRDNDDAADGNEADVRFTQYSATLARRWHRNGRTWEVLALPAMARDIGKSSTDFPDSRITTYPQETHLLFKVGVTSDKGWRAYGYAHPNNLRTDVQRIGQSTNLVRNRALDLGANLQRDLTLSGKVSARVGFDFFGRRGVEASEREASLDASQVFDSQTLDGEQDDVAAYGALSWTWGAAKLQAGTRFTWHQQQNTGFDRRDDTAWTGFIGLVQPLGQGFELTANLGTGLRFPNLSERFFSGTTGRGTVVGNPDLEPEESVNADLGLRWFGSKLFLTAQVFQTEIDDYIERVDVDDDLQNFVNLTSGTISGFELEGLYRVDEHWQVSWSGHLLDGEDDANSGSLADVPADRLQVGWRYHRGRWDTRFTYQYRAEKDDPGSGEKVIPEVNLVSLAFEYELRDGLKISIAGKNLLDEVYFNSADRKSPIAAGRSLGVGLVWEAD